MSFLRCAFLLALCSFFMETAGEAQRSRARYSGSRSTTYRASKARPPRASRPKKPRTPRISRQRCYTCKRDARGRIKRSKKAKNDFAHTRPCPATGKRSASCRGFRIDHITPLACGGTDTPANMQWLTTEQWKQKSKWERKGC